MDDPESDIELTEHLSFYESHLLSPNPFFIDPARLKDPREVEIGSRELAPQAIQNMVAHLKKNGFYKSSPLVGVTFCFEGEQPRGRIDVEAMVHHGVYVISGNHRRAALPILRNKNANNANIAAVPVHVLSCKYNDNHRQELVMLGTAYNDIEHFANAVTFQDK